MKGIREKVNKFCTIVDNVDPLRVASPLENVNGRVTGRPGDGGQSFYCSEVQPGCDLHFLLHKNQLHKEQ